MHPIDGLIGGREVIHAVGLPQGLPGLLRWLSWLPLAPVLHEWDTVAPSLVAFAKYYWRALAYNQHILFFVCCYSCLGEDGYVAVVVGFANAHQRLWKRVEGVGLCCLPVQSRDWY